MKREAEPIMRPKKRHEVANLRDALAAMKRSGSIHFLKTALPRTSIPALAIKIMAFMTIPAWFVCEYAHKIQEWVTLRIQSSNGRSSRSWNVRLKVYMTSAVGGVTVRFATGWKDFAASTHLKEGDSLIFLLKEGVRSEFEVHVFRGHEKIPYFPNTSRKSSSLDDDDDDENKDKVAPEQQTKHSENGEAFPSFIKRMRVSSILQTDGISLTRLGQFEFPLDFLETHGEHIQASVQLQGVREDSPVYVIPCIRSTRASRGCIRISFKMIEWNRFATANGLSVGQELRFSMTADSYFKVRVI